MKKLFSIFLTITMILSISILMMSANAANVVTVDLEATTTSGLRNVAKSKGTLWATQQDDSGMDIGAVTYVYLYYTKDGKESYYADYEEATDVNNSLYANMFPSVAKWKTDGSKNFHSKHIINGTENGKYVDTKKIEVSTNDFGK